MERNMENYNGEKYGNYDGEKYGKYETSQSLKGFVT